ncbi:MBL fold metallo-hydrolase [Immundisolibacter sp.]|uniref:MBL fold metallo-hydrolase n=1 Tax=Immundisolibacter sp. TaxID=1934948 RepID=UPI003565797E
MQQLFPDLWQTAAEHPFGPDVSTHAYLWLRPGGNVLFYNTGLPAELDTIERLGGIAWQYLSHRDEVAPGLAEIRRRFSALLCCHALEAPAAERVSPVDIAFAGPCLALPGLNVIPTPGHTAGSTCFRVDAAGDLTYLFTGDTLFPDGAGWGTYVAKGDRPTLRRSLELLRSPTPDVVLSSAARHPDGYRRTDRNGWQRILDRTIDDLR